MDENEKLKQYTAKQVLYKERMERARMMALFFDALCNHEKAVYRFSRYSVRGVALAFNEPITLAQVAHTPEEWCHIWETVYVKLKAYNKKTPGDLPEEETVHVLGATGCSWTSSGKS